MEGVKDRYPCQKAHAHVKAQVSGVKVKFELQIFHNYIELSLKSANLWLVSKSILCHVIQIHTSVHSEQ